MPELAHILITVGYKELFGSALGMDAAVDRIRKYSLPALVVQLSRLNLALSAAWLPKGVGAAQRVLVAKFLGSEGADKMYDRLRTARGSSFDEERALFFHERQVLNALKIGFMVVPKTQTQSDASLIPLLEALLALNDHSDDVAEGLDPSVPDGRQQLELYFFANTLHNKSRNRLHTLARSYYIFGEIAKGLKEHPHYVDLDATLESAYGYDVRQTWWMLFALAAAWSSLEEQNFDAAKLSRTRRGYFSRLGALSDEEADRWFDLSCMDIGGMQDAVQKHYEGDLTRTFDFLPFEQTPLVDVDGEIHCLSLERLFLMAGDALEHRWLDPSRFSLASRRRFLDFRGSLFEEYVSRMLLRIYGNRLYREEVLRKHRRTGRCCDGLIDCGDAIIVFECKSALVPFEARTGESLEVYREKIRAAVQGAAQQLRETAAAVLRGDLVDLGLDPVRIKRVFCVIVTWGMSISGLTYDSFLEHGDAEERSRLDPRIQPVLAMDIDELEWLELHVEAKSWSAQLEEKVSTAAKRRISFNHFWFSQPRATSQHHPLLQEIFSQASTGLLAFLRERGLPTSDASDEGGAK